MAGLTLQQASDIVDGVLEHARQLALHPLTVAVLDAGGHLVAFKRQDRSGILRPEIAQAKAWGTLGMGLGGRELARRADMAPSFYAGLYSAARGQLLAAIGGVLIFGADDDVIGAVGVSGDQPDHDEACAVAGIRQAGLVARPGGAPA
jgi:uncharacterized protein GlcG (DUF336 family)